MPGAPELTAASVTKIADAYLEKTWAWPRRHGLVAPLAFVLADPRVTRLDTKELQQLSADLSLKLFGKQGDGEVSLLTLEGEQTEILRFASADAGELKQLLQGIDDGSFVGRICKVTPLGVQGVAPTGAPSSPPVEPPAAAQRPALPEQAPSPAWEAAPSPIGEGASAPPASRPRAPNACWWSVYHIASGRFVGGCIAHESWGEDQMWGGGDDDLGREYPLLAMVRDVVTTERMRGYIFAPFNFSSLSRPTSRAQYREKILELPPSAQARLGAHVFNVPRQPNFGAVQQIRALLNERFSLIHLHVSDPGFAVESLPVAAVNTVTLDLSQHNDERQRLAVLTRFLSNAHAYQGKRASQGVAGLRTARELELCLKIRIAFVSGPFVAPRGDHVIWDTPWAPTDMPYRG